MDSGIGATLREARNRRKLDLSEIESAIKIRPRYLLALENEEWDVLPGGAYTRGFIRTYANYLGLDGERLADEYRRSSVPQGERVPRRIEPVPASVRRDGSRVPGRVLAVLIPLALVAAIVGIGLLAGDDGAESPSSTPGPQPARKQDGSGNVAQTAASKPGVAVRLAATAEVWVCLLDSREEPLVDGVILEAGGEAGPFRGDGFTAAFGNGEVRLLIDGREVETPPSSSPVGYEIGSGGKLSPLEEGERPDCT